MATSNTADVQAFTTIVEALKPLDRADQIRLLQTVEQFLGLDSRPIVSRPPELDSTSTRPSPVESGPYSTDRSISAKKFLLDKQPRTDVERVACLAYYLTHYRETPHFKTLDISKQNTEAAQPKFANAHYSVNNATTTGYLAQGPRGTKQISAAGEHFVQLMPDRDAARAAMANLLRRSRKLKQRRKAGGAD